MRVARDGTRWHASGTDRRYPSATGAHGRPYYDDLRGGTGMRLDHVRQRRQPSRERRIAGGTALAVLVVAISAFLAPAPANAEVATSGRASRNWTCYNGWVPAGEYYRAECNSGGGQGDGQFYGRFDPHGEHLYVSDCFPNDHRTVVYLDILDTPYVDYTRTWNRCRSHDFNLSISEGTPISLMACSSRTSGAKCSPRTYGEA
jgi:hypothetical protein